MLPDNVNNEQELLLHIARGDERAFRQLYDLYRNRLYFFIFNLTGSAETAEDMLQELFIKLWLHRASLAQMDNFAGWMHTVAYNHAINGLKRTARELKMKTSLSRQHMSEEAGTEARLYQQEMDKWLTNAVDELPPQQKTIFTLSRQKGLKYEEIASQLSLSRLTVKKHMAQALKSLRKKMQPNRTPADFNMMIILGIVFLLVE